MKNRKAVIFVVFVGIILALLFRSFFESKEEKQAKPVPIQNEKPDQWEEERKEQEQQTEQDKKEIEGFIKNFLTKYLEYDPENPAAHIESVKNDLDASIFHAELTTYKIQISDWRDRNLKEIRDLVFTPKDNGFYSVEAVAEAELTTTKGTVTYFTSFSFEVRKEETGWKIKTLNYYSDDGEE
jgi:hypothetical protein